MSWFTKKQPTSHKRIVVAVESLSSDILAAQLTGLEKELHTAGLSVRRMEFPTGDAEANIPGLIDTPGLLDSTQSLGLIAALDRARTLARLEAAPSNDTEVVLLTGSQLATAAWLGALTEEYGDRVTLYRWLSDLELSILSGRHTDLTIYIDCLPNHMAADESVLSPVGWADREVPTAELLRERFLEAGKLLPGVKTIAAHTDNLLKPDFDIQNELWNLVRRIALKSNLRPTI